MAQRTVQSGAGDFIRGLLVVVGALSLLAGMAAVIEPFLPLAQGKSVAAYEIRAGFATFGTCVVLGVFFFGMAAILKLLTVHARQQQLAQATAEKIQACILQVEEAIKERPVNPIPIAAPVEAAEEPGAPADQPELVELLQQIRDLTMMDERQRRDWAARHWQRRRDGLVKSIDREIDTGDWTAAGNHVAELRAILPEDSAGPELAARLEREQAGRLRQDLESAGTQVRHLMSITAWTQAEEIVASLLHRYPNTPEVEALAQEMRRERDTAERENYQRLILDLKDATDHKQWRRAALAAEELVRRFPDEPKVIKLKANDLDTLRENADAQERREEEAMFKDLLHRQRYDEAYTVAQRVITKFPTSSAALELAKLVPKVEELIRQERLKRHQTAGKAE